MSTITFDSQIDAKSGISVTGDVAATVTGNVTASNSITAGSFSLGKAVCGTVSINPSEGAVVVPALSPVPWNVTNHLSNMTLSNNNTELEAQVKGLYRIAFAIPTSGSWALTVDGSQLPDGIVDLPDSGTVSAQYAAGTLSGTSGAVISENQSIAFTEVGELTQVNVSTDKTTLLPQVSGVYCISAYVRTVYGFLISFAICGNGTQYPGGFFTSVQGAVARHSILVTVDAGDRITLIRAPTGAAPQSVYYANLSVVRVGAVP